MLYSSSREDLKQSLGAGFFASHKDFSAFDSDLSGAALIAAEQPKGDAPLTDAERLENEERTRPAFSRCAGMASVPFELSEEASTALQGLSTGLVEVVLGENETLELAQSTEETSRIRDALSALDAPRFVVVKRSEKAVLVFYCPDSAPIKQKMTYCTAKQTFSGLVAEKGIKATLVDCRDASGLGFECCGRVGGSGGCGKGARAPRAQAVHEAVAAGPPRLVAREEVRLGFERRGGDQLRSRCLTMARVEVFFRLRGR